MLDFVKALSDADRLRVVGFLSQKPMHAAEVATAMGIPLQEAVRHLSHLEHVGVVIRLADGVYNLDTAGLDLLARRQFEGQKPAFTPAPELDDNVRKVLKAYLNSDGTLKQIPLQPAKLKVILDYVLNAFMIGTQYTEKDVNALLRRFHPDTAALRRYLVDAGMLQHERDGSRYWRCTPPQPAEGKHV